MKTIESSPELCPLDALFLPDDRLRQLVDHYGTPLFLYDEEGLRQTARSLSSLFPQIHITVPVRLCPGEEILRSLAEEGLGAYCLTPRQLQTALSAGVPGNRITYAAVSLTPELAELLRDLDVSLLAAGPLALRHSLPRNVTLACSVPRNQKAGPLMRTTERARVGLTREEIFAFLDSLTGREGYVLGIGMIRDANMTDVKFLGEKAASLRKFAAELAEKYGFVPQHLHVGEGLGIRYRRLLPPAEEKMTADGMAAALKDWDSTCTVVQGLRLLEPNGLYVSSVLTTICRHCPTIVVDGTAEDLNISPVGRYRHVSIVGKTEIIHRITSDVVGVSAGENDWLADRHVLPAVDPGDLLILHDVGASASPSSQATRLFYRSDGTVCRL